MFCDAQVHIWGADRPERPWPEVHGEPHRSVPYSAEEVLDAMDLARVDRAIIVPPSWEGDRNDLAIDAAIRFPDRFGIMARVDLHAPSRAELSHWRERPGFLGVRLTFHRPEQRPWLTDGSADWLFAAAERHALPVMVLAPGQNVALAEIAQRHPELQLVIDHLNLATDASEQDLRRALVELEPLAELDNVTVKISALPCYVRESYPFPTLAVVIRGIIDRFGAERCMWGSDISRLPCPYADWARMFRAEAGVISPAEEQLVGGGTLRRVLRWI